MSKPPKTRTRPGLGQDTGLSRVDSAEIERASARRSEGTTPPPSPTGRHPRQTLRREEDPGPARPRSDRPMSPRTTSWVPEASTGTRRKRDSRDPVVVDEVGAAAVRLARTTGRGAAPKLIAPRSAIAKAPIDSRAAFVLSLIDGRNTVEALVDMSAMPEDEVRGMLARLARLGLISLP